MKEPFRFHRAELNGFFLYNLVTFLNGVVQDIKDELVYWSRVQFKLESEITDGEMAMRDNDIRGIAAIAGLFPAYFATGVWAGMVFLTESTLISGRQRSERGLLKASDGLFDFVHVGADDYPDDIVTEATDVLRQTLIPSGQEIIGYVRSDEDLYDGDGNIIEAHVYDTPPTGLPPNVVVEPFYGQKFLTLSSDAHVVPPVEIELTKALFEVMQMIRYNGPSVASFLGLTEILCPDLIFDIEITWVDFRYEVTYYTHSDVSILVNYTIWLYVVKQKFKMFELSNLGIA